MSDLGWYGRTWYDRRQNERIETMGERIAAQRAEAQRVQRQLAAATGNLTDHVDRLTTAFEAFVELSDLREELRAFDAEAATRMLARRILRQMVAGGQADAGTIRDVPPPAAEGPGGYWLPGALSALVAIVNGRPESAAGDLAVARAADPVRTNLFLALGLALGERGDAATELLPAALDLRLGQALNLAQRELWRAAATGMLGSVGRAQLVERLTALVSSLPIDTRAAEVARWREVIDQLPITAGADLPLPKRVTLPATMLAPLRAVGRMDALADWYQQALAGPSAAVGPGTSLQAAEDALRACIQELVDEGSPEERPLLARAADLRQVIEANGAAAPTGRRRWNDPVEAPLALLVADVRSDDAALKSVAAQAGASLVTAVADDLQSAAAEPLPDRVEVKVGRHQVRYRTMGVDPASTAEAQQLVLKSQYSSKALPAWVGWTAIGAGGALLLFCALVGALGVGLLAGLVGACLGAYVLLTDNQVKMDERAALQRRQSEWADTERAIRQVEGTLANVRLHVQAAPADASVARARLDAALAPATVPQSS